MTYNELLELINNDKTGIAKGYSVSFLQEQFCFRVNANENFHKLIANDLALFEKIERLSLEKEEPKEGDFVYYGDEIA